MPTREKTISSSKNYQIIQSFYLTNQTFVTKEELLIKGFDFSEWFSTSEMRHFFDNEENSFEYKDFQCGKYFVKTRDKNLENPSQKSRLFFQIISTEVDNVRSFELYKEAIKLIKDRKFADGSLWAYTCDWEMRNETLAMQAKERLELTHLKINDALPQIKQIMDSYHKNYEVFKDLYERLQKNEASDEKWI
jgi:hypothetical protein